VKYYNSIVWDFKKSVLFMSFNDCALSFKQKS